MQMHGVGKGLVTLLMKNCIRKGASGCVVFAPRERVRSNSSSRVTLRPPKVAQDAFLDTTACQKISLK